LNDDKDALPVSSAIPVPSRITHDSSPSTDVPSPMTHDASPSARLRSAILYLFCRTKTKAVFNLKDMREVLRAADNEYVYRHGRHLVREVPDSYKRGPRYVEFRRALDELSAEGLVEHTENRTGFPRIVAQSEPDPDALSAEEREIIDSELAAHIEKRAGRWDKYPEAQRPGAELDPDDDEREPEPEERRESFGAALTREFLSRCRSSACPSPSNPPPPHA
jgi:hypothetical protein